jgi:glycosyltransferase involved in cell wall biosynthesis
MDKVSVIIPVYNRSKTISRAINSVLNQTYNNLEIIVIDDNSQDDSLNKIRSFTDRRIKLVSLTKNEGAANARNQGVKIAKGKYIAFLDSDDYYEPQFIESCINKLSKTSSEIGFMWTGVNYITNNKIKKYVWIPHRKENAYLTFLHNLHIGTNSGIIIKKKVFEKIGGFNSKLPAAEDTDLFLKITKNYEYTYVTDALINIVKDGSDRLSNDFEKILDAYNIFLPEHMDTINKHKSLQQKYFYKLQWLNYHNNNIKVGNNYFKMLIKNKIINIKSIILFLMFNFLKHDISKKIHLYFSKLK